MILSMQYIVSRGKHPYHNSDADIVLFVKLLSE